MKIFKLLLLFLVFQVSAQQGGMWIPSLLEGMNEKEMKSLGSQLSAKDIYDVNNSSLKDAIVHFNGGCTSEIISDSGLLLTNHHCGYGAIQSHSSVEHDYLQDGFWAKTMNDELPNKGMVATLIVRIEDVTKDILKNIPSGASLQEQQDIISQHIEAVTNAAKKESWQDARVKSMYDGNQYMLFITETFKDIRLVGAPPASIGKFGSDTDNWIWPRHTGDFSLFRIYANKQNQPAEFSEDNVPYDPKHFLPVSLDGISENDFTLVFGFPGRTSEYLPSVAIDQIVNKLNPPKIKIRDEALKIVDEYMRNDTEIKIQYASKYARIANYWKKWIGESQGLKKSNAVKKKQTLEASFIEKNKDNGAYNTLIPEFERLYGEIEEVAVARDFWVETVYRNVELLNATVRLYRFEKAVLKNPDDFDKQRTRLLNAYKGFYKNYNADVDRDVFERLMNMYKEESPESYLTQSIKNADIEKLTADVYENSLLTSYDKMSEMLSGDKDGVLKKINEDVGYQTGKELIDNFYQNIDPKYQALNMEIKANQKVYMKALMESFPEERFFPDANGTLRVTYGKVNGYQPKDAVYYEPVSYLKGVIEKYQPGDYEFDLPEKLIELYNNKDYGDYGVDGKMPVNFIGTNHTTGGNSGSPVIDANGNLIGLNFDRVWEGTMSDYNYDPEICRNIMVDARYILFIIDKFADSKRLVDEMKLVHPKTK
ncbi:S46 family peptidase [Lutimonas zeaxanthinifaciens]|uniref:S46 family peptidase n=1 Tax=Lutimonas zeaxanthinifaciens TaxID=3060215 RepID=UPI00265D4C5F|nr:S46 family peptidase [Lutimonas sp. YSD2104]WKK66955.1 S46 family peptidase [Lutimonas sp. YSD2104]